MIARINELEQKVFDTFERLNTLTLREGKLKEIIKKLCPHDSNRFEKYDKYFGCSYQYVTMQLLKICTLCGHEKELSMDEYETQKSEQELKDLQKQKESKQEELSEISDKINQHNKGK